MPQAPRAAPRKLTRHQHAYFILGLLIGLIAFSAAAVGLLIVLDVEQQTTLGRGQFADLWRRTVQHNPFIQAFLLNFGAIGVSYSLMRLLEHRRALQAEQGQMRGQAQAAAESQKDR